MLVYHTKIAKKAWMNTIIIKNKNRKILLLLDNVSSRTIYGLQLNNIEVLFLPKNTT